MKPLEHYIEVGQQRLRCGCTTGTCAAAAARAAATLLLTGTTPGAVLVDTPAGLTVEVEVEASRLRAEEAVCAVTKDAGDDPDVTDGLRIVAAVRRAPSGFSVHGGDGVGRVTRPGLDQPPGAAAINSVPRRMILEQLRIAAGEAGYAGGLSATISVPEGARVAAKTFNPRLGIVGGVSILGTTGLVRPMSEEALIASIHAELNLHKSERETDLLLTPGSYGAAFCRDVLRLETQRAVQCSNYIGAALDHAALLGYRSVLLVGHAGKLIKVAAGVMNTHSRTADARLETLAAHAALCGADRSLVRAVMDSATTDAALDCLLRADLLRPTMDSLTAALEQRLQSRGGEGLQVEAILFNHRHGLLGRTRGADFLLALHRKER